MFCLTHVCIDRVQENVSVSVDFFFKHSLLGFHDGRLRKKLSLNVYHSRNIGRPFICGEREGREFLRFVCLLSRQTYPVSVEDPLIKSRLFPARPCTYYFLRRTMRVQRVTREHSFGVGDTGFTREMTHT